MTTTTAAKTTEFDAPADRGVAIKVDARQYRRKHGHEPRGRFLWTFRYGGMRLYFSKRGEYADCLAAALRSAAERGVASISVSTGRMRTERAASETPNPEPRTPRTRR